MKPQKQKTGWLGKLFFVAGMLMIFGAWWIARDTLNLLRTGVKTPGVVVELIEKRDSDGDSTYAPLVEVQSREYGTFRFKSNMSSNPPSFSVGEKVEVIVDPKDIKRVVINSFGQKWFLPASMTFMGSIFALVGLSQMGVLKFPWERKSGGTGT